MVDWLACVLVKVLGWGLCRLPPSACVWIGARLGGLAYWVQPKRAHIGYVNLKAALGDRLNHFEARRVIREVFAQMGAGVAEMLRLPAVDAAYVDRYIEIVGQSHLDAAMNSGRPLIILTGHMGNWELGPIVAAIRGYPITALARAQDRLPKLYQLLVSYRESKGCRVIHKGGAAVKLAEALRRGEVVGIVADQASTRGMFVEFFGRPALFTTGPAVVAQSTGAVLLPIFMHRKRGPFHRLVIEPAIEMPPHLKPEEAPQVVAKQFAACLSRHVEEDPGQWLWVHRRWKHTPARRVLVLSDGKLGNVRIDLSRGQALMA